MKKSRALSILIGLTLGATVSWVLDRFGSGTSNLFQSRINNPTGALLPDEVIPPEGRYSRIPSPVEDVMRGVIRAGSRVWADKAADSWGYVIEEIQGRVGNPEIDGPIIEIDPSTAKKVKIR